MDKFVMLLFNDDFEEVARFSGWRASVVIRAADEVAYRITESVTYYTNIPEEAVREYDRLGRVSLRHKPLRDLRRV